MIDTLKLSKRLQQAGMETGQAEGIADAINDAQADQVTKQDIELLRRDIALLKHDLELASAALELRLVKLANEARNQILLGLVLGLVFFVLAQVAFHFWH